MPKSGALPARKRSAFCSCVSRAEAASASRKPPSPLLQAPAAGAVVEDGAAAATAPGRGNGGQPDSRSFAYSTAAAGKRLCRFVERRKLGPGSAVASSSAISASCCTSTATSLPLPLLLLQVVVLLLLVVVLLLLLLLLLVLLLAFVLPLLVARILTERHQAASRMGRRAAPK